MSDTVARTGRRELTVAVVVAAVAAGLALTAGGQNWEVITSPRRPPLPPVTAAVTGGEAAPLVPAAALVLLASAGALLAVRGVWRVLVGLLMVVAGSGMTWAAARVLGGMDAVTDQLTAFGVPAEELSREVSPAWPVVATVAGVLGVLAGALVVVRSRRWPSLGRRYERTEEEPAGSDTGGGSGTGATDVSDEDRARSAWSALDRGEDPTEDPRDDRA